MRIDDDRHGGEDHDRGGPVARRSRGTRAAGHRRTRRGCRVGTGRGGHGRVTVGPPPSSRPRRASAAPRRAGRRVRSGRSRAADRGACPWSAPSPGAMSRDARSRSRARIASAAVRSRSTMPGRIDDDPSDVRPRVEHRRGPGSGTPTPSRRRAARRTGRRGRPGTRRAVGSRTQVGVDPGVRQASQLVDAWLRRAAEHVHGREERRDRDPVERAVQDDPEGRGDRDGALHAHRPPDPRDPADVDEPEGRRQHDRPERRDRQVGEEPGQEDEDQRHRIRRRRSRPAGSSPPTTRGRRSATRSS